MYLIVSPSDVETYQAQAFGSVRVLQEGRCTHELEILYVAIAEID